MEETVALKTRVRKTTRRTAVAKTTPSRPRAARKVSADEPLRKAPPRVSVPTPVITGRPEKRTMMVVGIATFLFLVLFGVSALIGLSDKGQLDVSSKIAARKESATEEEKKELESVPTEQNAPTVPNGGLVGMGSEGTPPPAPEVFSTTTLESVATSTVDTASSTSESENVPQEVAPSEATPSS